jgi:hypothetical protein
MNRKEFKGIDSQKFDMLLLVRLDKNFLNTFALSVFIKISLLSCQIFYYNKFGCGFLKVTNAVNESCYVHPVELYIRVG